MSTCEAVGQQLTHHSRSPSGHWGSLQFQFFSLLLYCSEGEAANQERVPVNIGRVLLRRPQALEIGDVQFTPGEKTT